MDNRKIEIEVPESFAREVIEAVRQNPKIGRGTCSIADECMSDDELLHEFFMFMIGDTSPKDIKRFVKCLRETQQDWYDRNEDIRNA